MRKLQGNKVKREMMPFFSPIMSAGCLHALADRASHVAGVLVVLAAAGLAIAARSTTA